LSAIGTNAKMSAYVSLGNLSPIGLLPNEKPLAAEKFAGAAPAESEQF